jgi:hypothetical protein
VIQGVPATMPFPATPPLLVAEQHRWIAHYVTDDEAPGPRGRDPRAVCGHAFRPACLAAPLGPLCPDCAAVRAPAPAPARQRRAEDVARAPRRRDLRRLLPARLGGRG